MAPRIGLLLAAGLSCGLAVGCGGRSATGDAAGIGGAAAGTGGSSGRGGSGGGGGGGTGNAAGASGSAGRGGDGGSAGTGGAAGGTVGGGGGGAGAGGAGGPAGVGGGGASGASGAAGNAGTGGIAGASGSGGRGGASGSAGTSGVAGASGSGGRSGASGNAGTGGAAGASGSGGSGASAGAGGSGGGGRGGAAGTAGAGTSGRGGAGGTGGGGGQLAPPCAQTIIDLPGAAFAPPTLVPTNAGLAVVWMNASDDHHLQGGRIVGGAFTGGWTSTFAVTNATIPAIWNGTDLALTYVTRGDNPVVNLLTVASDGSISSGPFPLPATYGLPVALGWNGNEYGMAWSDLTTVTFIRVGPDGGVRASQVLDGFRSPPSVQWDGDAWLISSAMIWTLNEPARLDVTRIAASGASLGKQSASTTGAVRTAQVTEIGSSIFAAFGNSIGVQFAKFDRALTSPPFATPLPAPGQVGAIGIAARGATLGIAMITFPAAIGLVTHFLEVDQMGQPLRTTQILGSSATGNLGAPRLSIVGTATGWAISWEDFSSSGYYDGRVSLLDCQ